MKRASWITLSIIVCVLSGRAQESIEVQGGVNIANLSDPGNLVAGAVWKSRLGFTGGILANIVIGDRIFICPGLRFVQKGTKSEWSSAMTGDVKSTVTNNYLELPVYLKYEVADFGSHLFLMGGPSFSYLLSSRSDGTWQLFDGNFSADTKEQYKSYDISFDLGLSAQTPLSDKVAIVATGLYSYGFVKIGTMGSNEQTRDIRVMIGVSYSLK